MAAGPGTGAATKTPPIMTKKGIYIPFVLIFGVFFPFLCFGLLIPSHLHNVPATLHSEMLA